MNLEDLRLSQDFCETMNVQKKLLTVPVRKPHRQSFVRVRPGEEWRLQTAVIEMKEERETYLLDRHLWNELGGEIVPKILLTTIDRQNVLFLWPIRLPGIDGRLDEWNYSAMEAAKLAEERWVSVRSNLALGAYEAFEASADYPEPVWPEVAFEEIIRVAFRDRFVRDTDHPVLRRLRGES